MLSIAAGFFLMAPTAMMATCGCMMMGVPIKLPNEPVAQRQCRGARSAGVSLLMRARGNKVVHFLSQAV
jgi:hypothetical protein